MNISIFVTDANKNIIFFLFFFLLILEGQIFILFRLVWPKIKNSSKLCRNLKLNLFETLNETPNELSSFVAQKQPKFRLSSFILFIYLFCLAQKVEYLSQKFRKFKFPTIHGNENTKRLFFQVVGKQTKHESKWPIFLQIHMSDQNIKLFVLLIE